MARTLNGIGVSRGLAFGKAHIVRRGQPEIPEYQLIESELDNEARRLQAAFSEAREQLKTVRERIPRDTPSDLADFIDTHLLMLQDDALGDAALRLVREQRCNAEWALKQQRDALVDVFDRMDDPYLRTRRDDIDHVVNRVLGILLQQETHPAPGGRDVSLQGHIVIADDLTPADMVVLQELDIAAFVTESGGPLSHTAILARSLGLPAIVGAHDCLHRIHDGEPLIVDGGRGHIIIGPDASDLQRLQRQQEDEAQRRSGLDRLRHRPAVSRDGQAVALHANIELPEELTALDQSGADGIGLFRTEFLYMNRQQAPDEEEQYHAYRQVVEALDGKPVTIRTLDLGADKGLDGAPAQAQANPALGLRAIRLCLRVPELFRPQLRAILRASAHGPVRLMIPMLSHLDELRQFQALLAGLRQELKQQGIACAGELPVGGMIEVPAAALAAHLFARKLDFLSLGTNDLIQYTLAIDRIDDEVNYLYDPLHPAVLQLIHLTLHAGREAGIPVSMCGEMAGDPRYTRLLLGLGLRDFSMQPSAIPEIKQVILNSDITALRPVAQALLGNHDPDATPHLLETLNGL